MKNQLNAVRALLDEIEYKAALPKVPYAAAKYLMEYCEDLLNKEAAGVVQLDGEQKHALLMLQLFIPKLTIHM